MSSFPHQPVTISGYNLTTLCDYNYRLLSALVGDWDVGQENHLSFRVGSGAAARLSLCLLERQPYTDILSVTMDTGLKNWVEPIELEVRMYRDIHCAEVVKCAGERLREHYPLPNARMFAPQEKAQLNWWLCEWLQISCEFLNRQAAGDECRRGPEPN